MKKCDTPWCGGQAGYKVYLQIEVWDLATGQVRTKTATVNLCPECEKWSRKLLARDDGQHTRVAGALAGRGAEWATEAA